MKLRTLMLLFVMQAVIVLAQNQTEKGSISGVVVDRLTGESIDGVHVILSRPLDGIPADEPGAQPGLVVGTVYTAAEGRFLFEDLGAGAYELSFERNGYVRQEYRQRVFPGQGRPVPVKAGETVRDLTMQMIPAGSVSGRIHDRDDQPVSGVNVWLGRAGYDAAGQKTIRSWGEAKTDDRGEYRIYFVTPGRYYLCSGADKDRILSSLAPNCYPGVATIDSAAPIDVQPGSAPSGLNWTVGPPHFHRVRGRVSDGRNGQPIANATVRLRYRTIGQPSGGDYWVYKEGSEATTNSDGVFELDKAPPGEYLAVATALGLLDDPARRARIGSGRELGPFGYVAIEIQDADVDAVTIVIPASESISGHWTANVVGALGVDGRNPQLFLIPLPVGPSPALPTLPPPAQTDLRPDGSFRINSVVSGEFRVGVTGLKPDLYLREARFKGIDALKEPLRFRGDESGTLEIVIGPNPNGEVEGIVIDERLDPAPMAQVVLVPDRQPGGTQLFPAATTDRNGRFSLTGITPGNYTLFAWEAIEPFAYFDRDLLARVQSSGQPMRVSEGSRQTVTARAIPANGP